MSDEVFKQDLSQGGSRPGGPFMIQLLFKEAVEMPKKEEMLAVMQKYFKEAECFSYDEKMAGFALNDHKAEFKDGKVPVQLMIMNCTDFGGQGFDPFLMSQMWDCMEDRDRIFEECKYQVLAIDMLAAGLPAKERADVDMDFMEALAKLYPTCEAFYFYADVLEITPIPTVEELNAGVWGEEFRAYLIDKAEFEMVWKARCYDDELSAPDHK